MNAGGTSIGAFMAVAEAMVETRRRRGLRIWPGLRDGRSEEEGIKKLRKRHDGQINCFDALS